MSLRPFAHEIRPNAFQNLVCFSENHGAGMGTVQERGGIASGSGFWIASVPALGTVSPLHQSHTGSGSPWMVPVLSASLTVTVSSGGSVQTQVFKGTLSLCKAAPRVCCGVAGALRSPDEFWVGDLYWKEEPAVSLKVIVM